MADELPPGVTIIGRIPARGGGEWALGSDGGVFALGAAQFFGSYPGLHPDLRQGERSFTRIDPTINGGYALTSDRGERYVFDPPTPAAPPTVESTPPAATQAPPSGPAEGSSMSGEAILQDVFRRYGLDPAFATELLEEFRRTGSEDAAMIKMRSDDRYKKRFSGLELRRAAGYGPMSEEQYVEWEGRTRALFDKYNIPKEFYDTEEELATFIGGDVSPDELKARVEDAYMGVYSAPQEYRDALQQMYGVDDGQMAAFWLDPTKGEEIVKKRWTAVQIGGEAMRNQFGGLTQAEAERLADSGVNRQSAQAGFGMLGEQRELMGGLLGETQGGEVSRETQLGSLEQGNVAAAEAIRRRGRRRTAVFEQGGDVAAEKQGLVGLGEAT